MKEKTTRVTAVLGERELVAVDGLKAYGLKRSVAIRFIINDWARNIGPEVHLEPEEVVEIRKTGMIG